MKVCILVFLLVSLACSQLFKRKTTKPAFQFGSPSKKQNQISIASQNFQVDENGYLAGRPPIVTTKQLMAKGSNYLNIMTRVKRLIKNRMDVQTLKTVLPEIETMIPGALTQIGSLLPTLKGMGGKNKLASHIQNFQKRFYKLVYGFEKNYPAIRQSLPSIISKKMPRIRSYGFSTMQIQMLVDNVYKLSKSVPIPASALR